MPGQRNECKGGQDLANRNEAHVEIEQLDPVFIREGRHRQDADEQYQRVHRHDDGGDALDDEIHDAIVSADDQALGSVVFSGGHLQHSEQFETEHQRQRQADTEDHAGAFLGRQLVDTDVQVQQQVADAGTEVVQVAPDQDQEDKLDDRVGRDGGDPGERLRCGHARREQRNDDQGQTEEQQNAADAVQDGQLAGQGQAIRERNLGKPNIAQRRTGLGSGVGHDGLGVSELGNRDGGNAVALSGKHGIFAQRLGWYQIVV
ncbi:hypothetical protein G6F57_017540 [Rhizopus arrhizus]|nr:hypothetical protein G6F57_017540 [Rhizopus arrhizus]